MNNTASGERQQNNKTSQIYTMDTG